MQARYSKLIVKDASGNLVQLLPEIETDKSLDATSNLPVANSVLYEKFQNIQNSIANYQGATSSASGVAGLVPPATSAEKDSFLMGDGTWASANTEFDLRIENGGSETTQSNHQYTSTDMGGQAAEYSDTFHLTHRAFIDNTLVVSDEGGPGKNQIDAITTIDCSSLTITSSSEVEVFINVSPTRADDFWITYDLTASLTDLLSAGANGLPMVEDASNAEPVMMPLASNGSELRVSCVDNNDGTYTFTPFVRSTITEVIEPSINLLIDNPDGTSANVAFPVYQGATDSDDGTIGLVPPATSAQQENFLKGDGTWATVSTEKDVAVRTSEPTAANTTTLANESIIFYNTGSTQDVSQPVYTSGNQTISGVKTFSAGIFSGKQVMSGTAMDCAAASCFTKTVTENTTFSFTNVPSDAVCCVTLVLINGGNYTVNWPSSVKWTGNLPPELTANGTDVLTFLTCTGGNVWYGTTTCIGVTA